jgi:hypothetical protein
MWGKELTRLSLSSNSLSRGDTRDFAQLGREVSTTREEFVAIFSPYPGLESQRDGRPQPSISLPKIDCN